MSRAVEPHMKRRHRALPARLCATGSPGRVTGKSRNWSRAARVSSRSTSFSYSSSLPRCSRLVAVRVHLKVGLHPGLPLVRYVTVP